MPKTWILLCHPRCQLWCNDYKSVSQVRNSSAGTVEYNTEILNVFPCYPTVETWNWLWTNFDYKIMNRITSVLSIRTGDIYTFLRRMGKAHFVKHHQPCFEYHLLFYNLVLASNPTPQNLRHWSSISENHELLQTDTSSTRWQKN